MKTQQEIEELTEHIENLVKQHNLNKREHQILLNMLDFDDITIGELTRKAIYLD